jgi:hypothetical protein
VVVFWPIERYGLSQLALVSASNGALQKDMVTGMGEGLFENRG